MLASSTFQVSTKVNTIGQRQSSVACMSPSPPPPPPPQISVISITAICQRQPRHGVPSSYCPPPPLFPMPVLSVSAPYVLSSLWPSLLSFVCFVRFPCSVVFVCVFVFYLLLHIAFLSLSTIHFCFVSFFPPLFLFPLLYAVQF